ncbi:hypothetical protein PZA11_004322 [Diplocarpon coronariae]|uniref:Indoleamine 2,3-dioxygenase n=1 Tax=Diplocarpon coronariae TaxID=2795749 RepID=A0A218YT89_9HELO|nr:hypothetical protein JHW43_006321 [Diplocarpon mali]OWO97718.1 indoleamine 2,3-dioxygenase [Marssonina coronariae]
MLSPLPVLSDYGISAEYGFLPAELPLERLPDPYYNKWEAIVANLQCLILSKRLRGVIDQLPVLSTAGLEHDSEWRRAYSLLCFMAHGYIWGGDSPSQRLPAAISVPLIHISAYLEVLPVATYAAVCLWNFKPLFQDEPVDNMENLATLTTFTGSIDESWFYLISVAIEARGAPILPLMITAIQAARLNDTATVTACLRGFAERLDDLGSLLQRMHDSCDPQVFYNRIRPFLAGSKNMGEAGLPDGVIYENGSGTENFRQYSGGSNAQSSIIQFFDIILGIEHHPTGEMKDVASESEPEGTAPPPLKHNFLLEMRKYMPGPHRRFLEDVAKVANIRAYVEEHRSNSQLVLSYDACLAMLREFRNQHINIVSRYIVIKSRESRSLSLSKSPSVQRHKLDLATASRQEKSGAGKKNLKGTGGTALIPFLKQARDETGEPAIESWARRVMNRDLSMRGQGNFFSGKLNELPLEETDTCGMAGTWTLDENAGGLCHH